MSEQSGGASNAVRGNYEENPINSNPGRPKGNIRPGPRQGRQGYRPTRFEGLCTDLKKHVYDVSQVTNKYDLFSITTQAIGEYVATHYDCAADFRIRMVNLNIPELIEPALPDAGKAVEVEILKLDLREYRDKQRKRKGIGGKAFGLILGKCSKTVQDRFQAADIWNLVNGANNVMALLRLIRQ